jgi:integrase/recombinase XerD
MGPNDMSNANDKPCNPLSMESLRDRFLEAMAVQGYSRRTAHYRRQYLGYFINWAEQRGLTRPVEITRPILERYQVYLFRYRKTDGQALTFRTQLNYLVAVRAWFKWLAKHDHVPSNPAAELDLPKPEQRLPKHVLTAGEAEQILNMADTTTPCGIRDRALLETLYSTGIRRMELAGLHLWDVDAERGTLTVRQGKGKKDRIVPIGARALAWIEKYLTEARPLLATAQSRDALFITPTGEPYKVDSLTVLVRRYVLDSGLGKTGACHLFRHTAATLMLENGADIRHIQALLGHANLNTTQLYTRVSIAALKAVHEATHPAKLHPNNQEPPSLDSGK